MHAVVNMNPNETQTVQAACKIYPFTNKRALYRAFMVLGAAYVLKQAEEKTSLPISSIFDAEGNATPKDVFGFVVAETIDSPQQRKKSK